jgi:hypothetical protein
VLCCAVREQVRGAYVKLERARAAELCYEDPIWPNIDGTHTNYDRCLDAILDEVRKWGSDCTHLNRAAADLLRPMSVC